MRHTKHPSKYMSLARLQEIAANHYCGRDGQDYDAAAVDLLIAHKADRLSDDAIADHYDYLDALAAHQEEVEAEFWAEVEETMLLSSQPATGDGTISAGACTDWAALVREAINHVRYCVPNYRSIAIQFVNAAEARGWEVWPAFTADGLHMIELITTCNTIEEYVEADNDWPSLVDWTFARSPRIQTSFMKPQLHVFVAGISRSFHDAVMAYQRKRAKATSSPLPGPETHPAPALA